MIELILPIDLEAIFNKVGLLESYESEVETDLSGFIFEKLSSEEPYTLTPLTQRQKEEETKTAKENEFQNMMLRDKVACLHKLVYDPFGQMLSTIKYEADPDTGKLVRKGEAVPSKLDTFEIATSISAYGDFYDPSNK